MVEPSKPSIIFPVILGAATTVIAAIIFYLLPHKTPEQVFILLSLLFLIPSGFMWHLWSKRQGWLKLILTIVVLGVVVAFGSYTWPPEAPSFSCGLHKKVF